MSEENQQEPELVIEKSDDGAAQPDQVQQEAVELSLEEQLAAAEAQAAEYLEGWKRARAEFDNARKRMERQRLDARSNATIDIVRKILPVIDDFGRAMENVPVEVAENSWFEGITLVQRKLGNILDSLNVERVLTVGEPFDPNLHEAINQEPSEEHESGVVTRELQAGYRLGDRVIRAALVAVAA